MVQILSEQRGTNKSWKFPNNERYRTEIYPPPLFPLSLCSWMGGIWDALTKSIKRSLESIKNGRTIYEEVLTTLLCEVESILNSWPLTSISDDITDFDALTPNHILLGSSQPNVEPSNYENLEVNYLKKWRAVQAYTNLFWKRWLSEYLPTLSPRTNSKLCSRNLFFCRKKIEKFDTVNENFPWLESQKYERDNINL